MPKKDQQNKVDKQQDGGMPKRGLSGSQSSEGSVTQQPPRSKRGKAETSKMDVEGIRKSNRPKKATVHYQPPSTAVLATKPRTKKTARRTVGPARTALLQPIKLESVSISSPPAFPKLSAAQLQKLQQPRQRSPILKKNSPEKKLPIASSQESQEINKEEDKIVYELTQQLGSLVLLPEVPVPKLPKITRHAEAQKLYKKYKDYLAELELDAQQIINSEGFINAIHKTLKVTNIKAWVQSLKEFKSELNQLQELPDIGTIFEDFERIRVRFVDIYMQELHIFNEIYTTYSNERIKYFNLIYNDNKPTDHNIYYLNYYEAMLTKIDKIIDEIKSELASVQTKFQDLSKVIYRLPAIKLAADDITMRYEKDVTELAQNKVANKQELDDLTALFGKL